MSCVPRGWAKPTNVWRNTQARRHETESSKWHDISLLWSGGCLATHMIGPNQQMYGETRKQEDSDRWKLEDTR